LEPRTQREPTCHEYSRDAFTSFVLPPSRITPAFLLGCEYERFGRNRHTREDIADLVDMGVNVIFIRDGLDTRGSSAARRCLPDYRSPLIASRPAPLPTKCNCSDHYFAAAGICSRFGS